MKKLQTLASLLLTLSLIILFVFWCLLRSSNLDQVLSNLDKELEKYTHLPAHIEGPLKFHLFPTPSFKIHRLEIGSSKTKSPYFISLHDLTLSLKILPILQKKVIFKKINANHFYIQLNLSDSLPNQNKSLFLEFPNALFQENHLLSIDELSLDNGTLESKDKRHTFRLTRIQLAAKQLSFNKPFFLQFKTNATYSLLNQPLITAPLTFKGTLFFPLACLVTPKQCETYLNLNGQVHAENIYFQHMKVNELNANLQTKSTTLLFNPMTMTLYQGESYGDLSFDGSSKQLYFNQTATNLHASSLFNELFSHNLFTGNLDLSLHAQMDFNQPNPFENLTGNGNFNLREGVIKNFNLDKFIALSQQKLNQLITLSPATPTHIMNNPLIYEGNGRFKLISVQFIIQQATLLSNKFIFQSEPVQLHGTGQYNFESKNLQAKLSAHLDTENESINRIQQLLGGGFPILVNSSAAGLKLIPDTNKLMPFIQSTMVEKTMQMPLDLITNQLSDFFSPAASD